MTYGGSVTGCAGHDCAAELQRIKDQVDPENVLITPTGVPDAMRRWDELRLFASEVMPHFGD